MITYHKGSVLEQPGIICHVVNDANVFGSGVAGAIAKKWPHVKELYHNWFEYYDIYNFNEPFYYQYYPKLGGIQVIGCNTENFVINMMAQSDPGGYKGFPPIRYQSLEECLMRIKDMDFTLPLIGPRFGCSLAGGSWAVVEEIINRVGLDFQIWDIDDNWNK